MPEPIDMIFSTLQHRCILNTLIYSMFLKFIIQSSTAWQILITRISLSQMLRGIQHDMFSKLVWTNCWTKSTAAMYWKMGR